MKFASFMELSPKRLDVIFLEYCIINLTLANAIIVILTSMVLNSETFGQRPGVPTSVGV